MVVKQGIERGLLGRGLCGLARCGVRRIAPTIATVMMIATSVMVDRLPAIAIGNTIDANRPTTPSSSRANDSGQSSDPDSGSDSDTTAPASSDPASSHNTADQSCPNDINGLAHDLLEDFPSYYNRTLIRSRIPGESASRSHVLLVSDPEIFSAEDLAEFGSEAIEGFFFTTLERTYRDGKATQQQGFHQVFLTRDVIGWLVVTTRSGRGNYPAADRMTPPIESSSGLLVQTVRTWLRDCAAR